MKKTILSLAVFFIIGSISYTTATPKTENNGTVEYAQQKNKDVNSDEAEVKVTTNSDNTVLTVEGVLKKDIKSIGITLHSVNGESLKQAQVKASNKKFSAKIDIQNLAKGTYIIEISNSAKKNIAFKQITIE